jgi:hypothetical protein
MAGDGLSANDPTATLAVHCGNGFEAGFSPYQSTRLNRKHASSRAKGWACNGGIFSVFWVAQQRGRLRCVRSSRQ